MDINQQFYIEKGEIGLEQLKSFVEYMMVERTKDERTTYISIYDSKEHNSSILMYIPLNDSEQIPDFVFTRNITDKEPIETMSAPKLIKRNASKFDENGNPIHPLSNLEREVSVYYNSGLKNGNLYELHHFACLLNKIIQNNINIDTYCINGIRKFKFTNPYCSDQNYYYENDLVNY
jgi:hypothetical protein